ncbi:flagellar hook-basal body complex protein FliE [Paucibacter sp. PLA-PC-4]|uniref:flagellar hook-basal body complex protein FliE n=1 Tax=Paucibacter sp. PLA-PC-4 TaxID=2993655 RepID=UPI0022488D36|nr:flagellar hook-basal body complex protein FliE [Paucibacter sp. PLA-PC-4]MCX2861710.1 flagellar hook-basal body complex protein FliE [Paucibacter sp. PLA-PC-4]
MSVTSSAASSLGSLQSELARIEQDALRLASGPGEADSQGFGRSMELALRQVDTKDQDAAARMTAVENGESDDLVGAMLASQNASLSFSMLMQVRNKVVGAVDELIKLQL